LRKAKEANRFADCAVSRVLHGEAKARHARQAVANMQAVRQIVYQKRRPLFDVREIVRGARTM
jgi:hypothetical protein